MTTERKNIVLVVVSSVIIIITLMGGPDLCRGGGSRKPSLKKIDISRVQKDEPEVRRRESVLSKREECVKALSGERTCVRSGPDEGQCS